MKIQMKPTLGFAFAIMILGGCASAPEQETPVAPPPPPPPPAYHPPAQSQTQSPVPKPTFKPLANDTCGANDLQYLIGKPRTDIPVPLQPSGRRVVCSTCVTTQEYRADRQTIVFDTDTGLIKSVTCG